MTPGAGRHRAADDAAEPISVPPPPFVPPSPHPLLLEQAFQCGSVRSLDDAPPGQPPPPPAAPEPVFIPLRRPRRRHRNVGAAVAALLAVGVVLGGGYVFLTRSTADSGAPAAQPLTIRLPSTTSSISPVAKSTPNPKATAVHLPVKFRSAKGHFAADFAHQPVVENVPGSYSTIHFVMRRAIDAHDGTMVVSVHLPALPASAYGTVLDGGMNGLKTSGAANLTTTVTTFRHHPARRATLTGPDGMPFTGIVTIYPGARMYILFAHSGAQFRALEKSFTTLP